MAGVVGTAVAVPGLGTVVADVEEAGPEVAVAELVEEGRVDVVVVEEEVVAGLLGEAAGGTSRDLEAVAVVAVERM